MMFTQADRRLLTHIYYEVVQTSRRVIAMGLNLTGLQSAVAKLQTDNAALVNLLNTALSNNPDPTLQAQVDAITGNVTTIDAADIAAVAASPAGTTGAAGPASPGTGQQYDGGSPTGGYGGFPPATGATGGTAPNGTTSIPQTAGNTGTDGSGVTGASV
jgi:hypothetical protein